MKVFNEVFNFYYLERAVCGLNPLIGFLIGGSLNTFPRAFSATDHLIGFSQRPHFPLVSPSTGVEVLLPGLEDKKFL